MNGGLRSMERHAWTLLVPAGLGIVALSIGALFVDGFDRATDTVIALSGAGFGIFLIAVSATALRRREKWAWFASLYAVPYFALRAWAVDAWAPDLLLGALVAVGLALSFRRVFPRGRPQAFGVAPTVRHGPAALRRP